MSTIKKIKLVTDITCDLSVEELQELDVDFVPVYVIIDGKKYKQPFETDTDQLYHFLIEEKRTISTAAPAPGEFFNVFTRAFEEAESVIFLALHGKLSAIYQTAKMVAEQHFKDKDITILDTKTVSLAQAIIVQEAAQMVRDGKSKEEIIARVNDCANNAVALPLLDTLEYLYRGGRIKLYQKLLGNFLGIKALIRIGTDGATVDGKVKGKKNAMIQIKMCGLQIQDHLKINRMFVAYTTNRELAEEVATFLKENGRKDVDVRIGQLGPVIGAHGGNDVVGYGFVGKYNPKMFTHVGEQTPASVYEKILAKIKG
ncbi:MAG: DegV family protein [Candidatus Thorarchaeota archaeon]